MIANETTLHKRLNDIEINDYWLNCNLNKGNSSIPLFKTHKSMDKNKNGVTN